jgi:16S rRNA (guanine527-N7)-methyltransferase
VKRSSLAERFGLDSGAAEAVQAVLELLAADPAAPTAVTDPEQALDVHFADSLVALELEAAREARALADVGAGAGFPGLALAIALPESRVWLVESAGRRCEFLRRAVEAARLENADVVHARVEEWDAGRQACDLVTARALAPLPVLAEYAAPLLRPGGTLVAWKGRRDAGEEHDGDHAARELGLEPVEVRHVRPYPGARDRHLHVYSKVRPTPDRFPRRAGMAAKRPLRAPG